ncbi:MAG: 2Fe-2S iron-sulfur cluster-binding protein, partial [Acidimicrobiia bacterium]
MDIQFRLNGEDRAVDAGASQSLLSLLRDGLGLPGSKNACEQGECGSCTVVMDGRAVCSCLV